MTDSRTYSVEKRAAAALNLLQRWAADIATAQGLPEARWILDDDARLHGMADGDEDTAIWADYLRIDLTRTETSTLTGYRNYTPHGPSGPVIPVILTST
ncbi:hypothetical protein ACFWU3_23410 [Streptomyces sp. NPDC058685]|uniref:hypothetical protein n=1 Tax=Streptomyces sp. NPDC058685 TaxID=3346598 RepID=UPI0036690B09